ncbi:peptidase domain-containing ABC transporter [Microbispora sp. ATCC PTA-5024]|uniref:peptidase domain-containing ABC transporter n=1 Tax=Microbispora sp. ATCC PTA-5024 TaxID=316330 RepID=UPI000563109B|nr:peptidase domain-containing ABC transporter [Microbispora sp. ATCC PTA-5024]
MRRRVPLRMQQTQTDCGAACLAMVLGALGRRTSIAEVWRHLPESADGATLRDLIGAATAFGLRLRAFRLAPDQAEGLPTPFVAHWEQSHFVVVERVDARGVVVADPASGRLRLSRERFAESYSGTVLVPDVPERLTPPEPGRSSARAVLSTLARAFTERRLILQVVAATALVQLFGLAVPLFTKLVVDGGALSPGALGLAAAVAVAAHLLVSRVRSVLLIRLQTGVAAALMRRLVGHVLALPYGFFQRRTSGDLLSRLSAVSGIRNMIAERSLALLFDLLTALSYLVALAVAAPGIAALTAAAAAAQTAVVALFAGRSVQLAYAGLHATSATQTSLVESLSGIEALKAAGAEDGAFERWQACHRRELETSAERDRTVVTIQAATEALQLALALGLLVVVRAQLPGSSSLGDLLALAAMAGAAIAPLSSLLGTVQQIHLAFAHLDRVADLLAAAPEPSGGLRPALRGAVEVRGVSAGYDPRFPVLHDVSLRIPAGARVAVVGGSGSGKTTLGRVLLGLVEPARGEVRFDGLPLPDLDPRHLRRQVGVVTQQPHLFSGTVLDTIAFGDPSVTPAVAEEAARLAEIHDEIRAMPLGYRTHIGESGGRLSGGQRQRLALARALARRPRVLLLDEPTSALDALTEERIRLNLAGLGITQIVIAHRLSTIRDADLIVVLEGGRVVETGTHDELLSHGRRYAGLVSLQATPG